MTPSRFLFETILFAMVIMVIVANMCALELMQGPLP